MEEKPQRSQAMSWFLGCLVALVAIAVLCAGGCWLAADRIMGFAVDKIHGVMVEAIEESYLPEEQVASIKNDLGRLRDAVIEKRVVMERVEALDEEIERVLSLGFLEWFEHSAIDDAGMEPEEAEAARRTVQRFARGINERKLDMEHDLDNVNLQRRNGDEHWDIDSIQRTVRQMQEAVENANIPDEPYQADIGREFTILVDNLIQQSGDSEDSTAGDSSTPSSTPDSSD